MEEVLVTGANGFVGQALCTFLRRKGIVVRGAVRLSREPGIPHLISVGDIDGQTSWQHALNGVESVVHLAARVHVMEKEGDCALTAYRKVNVDGTLNLARQAAAAGVRRFIFLSTIKVNGEETGENIFSFADPPSPVGPYATSKFEAEEGLGEISQETGLEVVVIRPPLIYGKGVGGNFSRLVRLVEKGLPFPFAAVNNRRSLVYIENICDLIRVCLHHKESIGKTLLVSDGQDVSTAQLYGLLARYSHKKARLLNVSVRLIVLLGKLTGYSLVVQRLTANLQVDSLKTERLLNWTPPFTLEQGIRQTLL